LRTLAVTQNITVDGSIEMLGDWFDPKLRLLEAKAFRSGVTYSRYGRA
jgi:hypothetical protein